MTKNWTYFTVRRQIHFSGKCIIVRGGRAAVELVHLFSPERERNEKMYKWWVAILRGTYVDTDNFPTDEPVKRIKTRMKTFFKGPLATKRPKALGLTKNFGPKSPSQKEQKTIQVMGNVTSWFTPSSLDPTVPYFKLLLFFWTITLFTWFDFPVSLKMHFEKLLKSYWKVTNLVPVQ